MLFVRQVIHFSSYLHFLDKYISPRAMKRNLMPVEDSSVQEGSDEDRNKNDAISDDMVGGMDLSSVFPREDEESENTTNQDSLRQGIQKGKGAKSNTQEQPGTSRAAVT